jgi:hypothetical protein
MALQTQTAIMDTGHYLVAVAIAERRALHSYFDQHVIEDNGTYLSIDEGDYSALPTQLIDKVVHTVPGAMNDEW